MPVIFKLSLAAQESVCEKRPLLLFVKTGKTVLTQRS